MRTGLSCVREIKIMSYGTGLTFISLLEKMMSSLASLKVVQHFFTFSKIGTELACSVSLSASKTRCLIATEILEELCIFFSPHWRRK